MGEEVVYGPEIYHYLDYRAYLRAYYEDRKIRRGFSFRVFSRRAGLGSPNYLKLVMDAERNLSDEMAARFAVACRLDAERQRYFVHLVAFNQADSVQERNRHYKKLSRHDGYRQTHALDGALDRYHSHWYLPAIRELVCSVDFREDPAWIARVLSPEISEDEASAAIDTLLELGMLVRDEGGCLRQGDATVSTGPEVQSLHLANFHRTMIEHAESSLDRVPGPERDISSLTLCLGEEGLQHVKWSIQKLRKELLELESVEPSPRQVVQINFQLFPLTLVDHRQCP